jgi:tetratricopeptide (TPR) repeat protein
VARRRTRSGLTSASLALLCLLACAADRAQPTAPEPVPPERDVVSTLAALGEDALARGELEQAEARFERALAAQPDSVRPRLGLARVALARDDASEAERQLGGLLERDPPLAEALVLQAEISRRAGRVDEARAWLERALAADPDQLEAHTVLLGLTGLAPRRPTRDATEAIRVAERHPYDPWAQLQAARLLLSTGRKDEAVARLASTVWFSDLDPDAGRTGLRLLQQIDARWATRRIVPVHCYADESVTSQPTWRMRARLMWAKTSTTLAPLLDSVFVVTTLSEFSSRGASDVLASIDAAFRAGVARPPSRGILIAVTERPPPRQAGPWRLGQAEYMGRRMVVRLEAGRVESRTLLHEILHLYGGIHIAEDVDSLMNPSGQSLELDPMNRRIVTSLRDRDFGPGGPARNVLPVVDRLELREALEETLRLNLHFRRLGIREATEESEHSRYVAARLARKATGLDEHLASVADFVAQLLVEEGHPALAARYLEAASRLHGSDSAAGQRAARQARALWQRAAREQDGAGAAP